MVYDANRGYTPTISAAVDLYNLNTSILISKWKWERIRWHRSNNNLKYAKVLQNFQCKDVFCFEITRIRFFGLIFAL